MTRRKLWSKSLGKRGHRVRVYEARPGGTLMRSVYVAGKEVRKSLGHCDKQRAQREALELIVGLMKEDVAPDPARITLAGLARWYVDSPSHAEKKERTRKDDARKIERLVAFLGADREVGTLSSSDVKRYVAARRRGDPMLIGVTPELPVRDRAVEADLVALHTVLNWGTKERDFRGRRLLNENPLRGTTIPKERNPVRAVMTHSTYIELLRVADTVHPMLRPFLAVVEGTGRRLSACRQLRWADVDFAGGTIRWRAATDKKGFESVIPITADVADALSSARGLQPDSEWVFPSPSDSSVAAGRHLLDDWLRRAFKAAGLTPRPGEGWHALRRKFATERKGYAAVDVAAAGGWRDLRTVQNIYQHADLNSVRDLLARPSHRIEAVIAK